MGGGRFYFLSKGISPPSVKSFHKMSIFTTLPFPPPSPSVTTHFHYTAPVFSRFRDKWSFVCGEKKSVSWRRANKFVLRPLQQPGTSGRPLAPKKYTSLKPHICLCRHIFLFFFSLRGKKNPSSPNMPFDVGCTTRTHFPFEHHTPSPIPTFLPPDPPHAFLSPQTTTLPPSLLSLPFI